MTPGYKARRAANHAAQKTLRAFGLDKGQTLDVDYLQTQTIDLTPKIAGLSWVGGKSFKQSFGGRKNASSHAPEWALAVLEDRPRIVALQLNSLQANTLKELLA